MTRGNETAATSTQTAELSVTADNVVSCVRTCPSPRCSTEEVYVYAEVDKLIRPPPPAPRSVDPTATSVGKNHRRSLRVAGLWVTWGGIRRDSHAAGIPRPRKVPIVRQRAAVEELRGFNLRYPLAHLRPFLSTHERGSDVGGEEVVCPDAEVTIRTGQALLGDARWLAIADARSG